MRPKNTIQKPVVGGGAVSVFYEQLGINCHLGQLFPWAKETLLENSCGIRNFGTSARGRRNQPRDRMIHEQPTPIEKAPATTTTSKISGLIFNIICKSKISTSASKRSGLSPQLLLLHLHRR